MNTIQFAGKEYEFAGTFEMEMAQGMLLQMRQANKPDEYIASMLAGLGKLSDKAEKFAALEEYQNLTSQFKGDETVRGLVASALAQFANKSELLGLELKTKLGNTLAIDVDASDMDSLYVVLSNAANMTGDEVKIIFDDDDEGNRFARVTVYAKDALEKISKAQNYAATALMPDEWKEKSRVTIGDDWYPKAVPLSGVGGSKVGLTKTRYAKVTWHGQVYDGLKKDVAQWLIRDGMPKDQKIGDKKVTLSKEYYAKWLQQLNEAGAFGADNYETYNKES